MSFTLDRLHFCIIFVSFASFCILPLLLNVVLILEDRAWSSFSALLWIVSGRWRLGTQPGKLIYPFIIPFGDIYLLFMQCIFFSLIYFHTFFWDINSENILVSHVQLLHILDVLKLTHLILRIISSKEICSFIRSWAIMLIKHKIT